jgi:hypothetical protein
MKVIVFYLVVLSLGFQILDCSSSKHAQQSKPFPIGDYQYIGYDKNRVKIVEGKLSITSVESGKIKGEWQLRKIGNPENIGPQIGSGKLEGEIDQDKIRINLNPNMADNNVNLTGKFDGNNFSGTWSFDGFAGGINRGSFEAKRSK